MDTVHSGENTLTIALDQFAGALVDAVRVDVDATQITASTIHPEQLRLLLPTEVVPVAEGDTVRIPITLQRRGQRPDHSARVTFTPSEGLHVVGTGPTLFAAVEDGVSSYVDVRADGLGEFELLVETQGGYNDPGGLVVLNGVSDPHP